MAIPPLHIDAEQIHERDFASQRKEISACTLRRNFPWLFGGASSKAAEAPVIDGHATIERDIESKAAPTLPIVKNDENNNEAADPTKTVYYLAYGSNLSAETFLGRREIRPLSQKNVVVPSLRLTFDLPGIPYVEPCFANSALRDDGGPNLYAYSPSSKQESTTNLLPQPDYHKNRWGKGLVGVVYELTPKDFAHVIGTEGGGASYKDIVIPCYPLAADPSCEVPLNPSDSPIEAHTLYAPARPPPPIGQKCAVSTRGRFARPDPSYAQPSARYLNLITTGAAEHALPNEYREYLAQIRPYIVKTQKQRLGRLIFIGMWWPIIQTIFLLQKMFQDKNGISPPWLVKILAAVFGAVWESYDWYFKSLFGDGERTIGQ